MKKRIVSLLLTVVMLFSVFAVAFAEANIEEVSVDQTVSFAGFDDFSGANYSGLVTCETLTVTKENGPEGEGDNAISVTTARNGKLHFYYSSGNVTNSSSKSVLYSDHIRFSYDFYADASVATQEGTARFLRSYIGMKTTSSTEQLKFTPQFFWSSTEGKLALRIGDSDLGRYYIPDKKWYTIEHTYDFTNIKNAKVGILINVIDKETGNIVETIERKEFTEKGGSDYTNGIEYIYFDAGSNDYYDAKFIFDNFRFEKLDDSLRIIDFVSDTKLDTTDELILTAAIPSGFVSAGVYVGDVKVADIANENSTGFYKISVPVSDFISQIDFGTEYAVAVKAKIGSEEISAECDEKISVTKRISTELTSLKLDFEDKQAGYAYTNSSVFENIDAVSGCDDTLVVSSGESGSGNETKFLSITSTAAHSSTRILRNFIHNADGFGEDAIVRTEFDAILNNIYSHINIEPRDASGAYGTNITFASGSVTKNIFTSGGNSHNIGIWHHVRVDMNPVQKTFKIYINGELDYEDTFTYASGSAEALSRYRLNFFSTSESGASIDMGVDNFRTYYVREVPYISEVKYISSDNEETGVRADIIPSSAKAVKLYITADDINNEDVSLVIDGTLLASDKYILVCDSAADCVTVTPVDGLLKANTMLEIEIAEKDSLILYIGNDKLLYVASSVSAEPISGTVEAVNGSGSDMDVTLIIAAYNSNMLTGIDSVSVTVPAGKKVSDSLTLNPESASNEARVFIFKDMDLIKPLIAKKSVSVVSE